MKDLQNTQAMWLKGGLFLLIGLMSGGILLIEHWSWRTALLLGLCVWGFCRAYYFAFYVIERWGIRDLSSVGWGTFWSMFGKDGGGKPRQGLKFLADPA